MSQRPRLDNPAGPEAVDVSGRCLGVPSESAPNLKRAVGHGVGN